jgi:hypothetical protein
MPGIPDIDDEGKHRVEKLNHAPTAPVSARAKVDSCASLECGLALAFSLGRATFRDRSG